MKTEYKLNIIACEQELLNVAGGGLFYNLSAFFADVASAGDSMYSQCGNTNMNHHW